MAGKRDWKNNSNWKQEAKEKENRIHEMIHDIGMNYSSDPMQIAEMMAFSSKFYTYSLKNTQLIYKQNPYALYVQSYPAWKKMGANVKKGEHGIQILVPVKTTYLNLGDGEFVQLSYASEEQIKMYKAGLIEGKQKLSFKIGNVFDISQTDFPTERYPELFSVGYSSREHEVIANGLVKFSESLGCHVRTSSVDSITLRGAYSPTVNVITINELLKDTQRLSTLTHEIGHMLAEHGKREGLSTSQKEFEADCISIMMQSYYDIELTDTRKKHLADHYNIFMSELKKNNPNLTDEDVLNSMDEVLNNSMRIFKEHLDQINLYVDKELENEKYVNGSNIDTEEEPKVSYEVVECSEFPLMGEVYTDIDSVEEALDTFEAIDDAKKSMIPGVNIRLSFDDADEHLISIPVIVGSGVDLSNFDYYNEIEKYGTVASELKHAVNYIKKHTSYNMIGTTKVFEHASEAVPVIYQAQGNPR